MESRGFSLSLRASETSVAINDSGRPTRLIASGDALAMTQCDVRLKSHLRCH
ncbi:MAG: hypothetical protein K2N54_02995 [Helicobacter sp.]|nr:hypothetical protein [Helicobacter sp.]